MHDAGEICALITAVLWTGSALTFSAATRRVGSIYVNVARLVVAAVMLLVVVVFIGEWSSVSATQLVFLIFSGFVGFVFGDTFLFKSFEHLSVRISMLVMALAPAFTAVFAYYFLNETLTLLGLGGIAVTIAGIALVVLDQKDDSPQAPPASFAGLFYAVLGAAGQAGGLILARKAFALGDINGFLATFIRVVAATAVILPMNYFAGKFSHPVKIFNEDRRALVFMIMGAFFGPFLGVTFGLISISLTSVAVAATLMATTPIFILPLAHFFFHEKLTLRAVAGAFIAVAGIAILFLR
ncbi:MAG: DMT family transporter [Bacteroidota bacterium]